MRLLLTFLFLTRTFTELNKFGEEFGGYIFALKMLDLVIFLDFYYV